MATFTSSVRKAIEKAKTLEIKTIAPGHGPVYRKNPQKIMDDYIRYSLYAEGAGKNEVTILWGTMYGMTAKAVDYAESILQREGVKYNKLRMPLESSSNGRAVLKSAGIIIAAPTYEYKLFPPVAAALMNLQKENYGQGGIQVRVIWMVRRRREGTA